MRITVVGAILIVATAVAIVLLIHALNRKRASGSDSVEPNAIGPSLML